MAKSKSRKPTRKKEFTEKEARLVKAFLKGAKSKKEAALIAGYSPKNPTASANQALESIKLKAPDIMDKLGLTVEHLIENHLRPLLHAEETKLVIHEGKVKSKVQMADNTTRRYATRMAFELQGAFPPQDQVLAAQIGVEVVVIDIPRPDRSVINVTPAPKAVEPSPNGSKPDPRPQQ
jgi:hypothetical protein